MFNEETLVRRLGQVSHFSRFEENDLKVIVAAGHVRRFTEGQVLFCEGLDCAGLFVLFRGCVDLYKLGPQGQEVIISSIKPVIMFNEVAVLDGGPNPITAVAVQECITWQVSHENFQNLMYRYPPVGLGLLKVLAARNRALLSLCEDVSFRTVLARTGKVLLDLSQNGEKPINRRLHTNQEIAARAATVPEPVSRSIRILKQNGLIDCCRSWIKIRSAEQLAELAFESEFRLN